ncbi:MAG: hypothetical protein Q4E27_06350 [Bacteroidales bacterium]|nr:hypothetical protein [Bacteroidales bacterium]
MKRIITLIFITLAVCFTSSAQTNRAFRKGFQGSVEIGNSAVFGKDKAGGLMELTLTPGYRTGYGLFLGAGMGIGYNLATNDYVIPAYFDAKYNFLDRKVSPFAGIRTGIRFNGSPSSCIGNFIILSGGINAGAFSIRLGYEYAANRYRQPVYRDHSWVTDVTTLEKPSMLFCSFAVNF